MAKTTEKVLEIDAIFRYPPRFLFDEYTFLDERSREHITRQCLSFPRTIPLIDYYEPMERFLFHTLYENGLVYRKGCANFFTQVPEERYLERDLELALCRVLDALGASYRRQVPCGGGVADVVSGGVVEVKLKPGRSEWHKAIGQAISYRAALGLSYAAVLSVNEAPDWVQAACESAGIKCFSRRTINELATQLKERAAV